MRLSTTINTSLIVMLMSIAGIATIVLALDSEDSVHSRKIQKWEYKVVSMGYGDAVNQEKSLNELGAIGWELVTIEVNSVSGQLLHFATVKRPIP